MNNFFYYLTTFIFAVFFILVGALSFFLPRTLSGVNALVNFILDNSWMIHLFGIFLIILGVAMLINIRLNTKKRYYKIKAANLSTILDEKIFEQYLDTYWKELFPNNQILSDVAIKNNKLYITADLPTIPLSEQKPLLQQIESDLNEMLIKYLGYHHEYIISINFQPETVKA